MKNTSKTTVFDSQKQAASALGIPLNRLRAAKKAGCTAFRNGRVSSDALLAWIRAHKPRVTSATTSRAVPLIAGAAGNLRRLEESETQAWVELQRAIADGDPDGITSARRAFLETSEALRRLDRDVAESRRDAGALVARADVERGLRHFGCFLHAVHIESTMGALKELSKLAPQIDPQVVSDIFATMEWKPLLTSAAGLCSDRVTPPWLSAAVLSFWESNMHKGISDRAEKIAEMLRHLVSEPTKAVE